MKLLAASSGLNGTRPLIVNHTLSSEISNLLDVVEDQLGVDQPEGFTSGLPLFSNSLTENQIEEVRVRLQDLLVRPARGTVPVVTVFRPQDENQAAELKVTFLKSYVEEFSELGWFVDVEGDACWYFKAAEETSARKLACFFNLPENRRKLDTFRFESPTETSLLKHWLLQLRPGIDVVKFGYKSGGLIELVESDMLCLVS